ncbi:MAG: peptidylprolyl isomerase [Proteobacteria bacterium]|nr:peptidylprolyl isomerase [Pseudomonadota bacterium]
MPLIRPLALAVLLAAAATAVAQTPPKRFAQPATVRELLATSQPSDWRPLDPEHTLYLDLAAGRVIIELEPLFAPRHVANIEKLARAHWYDGLAFVRLQDNFVAQFADPLNSKPDVGEKRLPAEFTRSAQGLAFTRLRDPDTFAPEVGFVDGFAVARSGAEGDAWPVHCYGVVGVGRDNDPATAIGTELYVVIGHSPRQLDRNVAVVGRVVMGIELLSSLPRGTGELGFYEQPEQRVPIQSVRVAAELPAAERRPLEVMRTDAAIFQKLVELRRNRKDAWYKVPAGRVDVCNVPVPVRDRVEKPEHERADKRKP